MTDTKWQPDLTQYGGPKYLALCHALRDAVRSGALPEKSRLLPVRELAWQLGITPGTVARAYGIATKEGLLEAVVGRGTFVAARHPRLGPSQPMFPERKGTDPVRGSVVDLRSPQLPEIGQGAAIAAALRQVSAGIGPDYLEYPNLTRDRPTREAMVGWLADRTLGPIDADDLVLSHGGQNAIGIVLQCCLRGDRPAVFAEELAYPGFRHSARLMRADVVPIALDGEGMRADALDAACNRYGGRIVCITTEAQNPTAVRMSAARRAAIVAVARNHDLQIIEDDCYSVASATVPSLRALAPERVWHVTSLSKSISAGLRFGTIVCPVGMGEAGRLTAQHNFFGLARPITDLVTTLMASGIAAELRDKVQAVFQRRQEIAVNILGGFDMTWQPGLSFIWLRLPIGWRASTFARLAEGAGVLVRSADEYATVDGHAPNAVRVALAAGIPEARFEAAMRTLADLLRNPPGDLPV